VGVYIPAPRLNNVVEPLDMIISKMKMDLVNRVEEFERFMMTDPGEGNYWSNLKNT
jgi:hypothetical protein